MPKVKQKLTRRQRQVLSLASEGLGNKDIAVRLKIAPNSVKAHLSAAYKRLGISGCGTHSARTRAVRECFDRGLIPGRQP